MKGTKINKILFYFLMLIGLNSYLYASTNVFECRIDTSIDDVEERDGKIRVSSSDLELIRDKCLNVAFFSNPIHLHPNRKSSDQNRAGDISRYRYDSLDNLLSIADANGHKQSYEYNDLSLKTKETKALGTVVESSSSYEYDDNDNLKRIYDEKGDINNYLYDNLHRVTYQELRGTGGSKTKEYIAYATNSTNHQSTKEITRVYANRANRVTLTTYDALNRKVSVTAKHMEQFNISYNLS